MSALARTLYHARRQAGEWWGLLVVLTCAYLVASGRFSATKLWAGELFVLAAVTVYAATLTRAIVRELGPVAGEATRRRGGSGHPLAEAGHELELGLLLTTGVYLLIVATGGLASFLYPLVYALVSFLLIIHKRRWVACSWIAAACLLEIGIGWASARAGVDGAWAQVALHLTFLLFFAAGNLLVLGSLARRLRGRHADSVSAELARIRQEARDFRLIASQLPLSSRATRSRDDEELRMAQGAVHAVHEQLFFSIDLLCASLDLHTAALLWVEADRDEPGAGKDSRRTPRLTIKEMATASEMVREDPVIESPGVLAAVLRDPKPLRLKSLGGRRVPPYYQGPEPVTDLCVVPLADGKVVRGVLCADRIDDRPFSEQEQATLVKAGEQCLRIIEQERAFAAVERGKYEQEQFYRASELLNQALTLEEVYSKTFAALSAMAAYDLAVLTRYDAGAGEHEVLAVEAGARAGEGSRRDAEHWQGLVSHLKGRRFTDGTSLVSMAVKNRHHMPATGDYGDSSVAVFDPGCRLDRARSVLVLPLVRGEQVLGTISVVSSRAKAYPPAAREMLRVISHQVGVSLQNARMYQSMEERATTDGLTGLTNHRAFQERLEQLHALAERSDHKFSIILTDIDHFKSVNDTYGHPVGDAVLKRVAALFTSRARKVDIVARYGGEEFVLVLPDTDAEGAAVFANRLREEVAAQTISSEHGSFGVTISMGVAEYPGDGRDRHELIERADQALYYCKEHGRNCVTKVRDLP